MASEKYAVFAQSEITAYRNLGSVLRNEVIKLSRLFGISPLVLHFKSAVNLGIPVKRFKNFHNFSWFSYDGTIDSIPDTNTHTAADVKLGWKLKANSKLGRLLNIWQKKLVVPGMKDVEAVVWIAYYQVAPKHLAGDVAVYIKEGKIIIGDSSVGISGTLDTLNDILLMNAMGFDLDIEGFDKSKVKDDPHWIRTLYKTEDAIKQVMSRYKVIS